MISRAEIEATSESLEVHTSHVQRDYVHGLFLWGLYAHSPLGERLVLKGGNCLRKGYFANSRYSRDLDFSVADGIDPDVLREEINKICLVVQDHAGVIFQTERTHVGDKRVAEGSKSVADVRIYFKDFYGRESSITLAVRMDIIEFDRLHLAVQERQLIHPYSDRESMRVQIRCVKLEELLATKMRCLLQRRHIADLYDLIFATMVNRDIEVDRSQLLATFFKITIFGISPGVAKGLLLDLPIEGLKRFWTNYIACPNGPSCVKPTHLAA